MAPNARQSLIIKIQEQLSKLSTSQLKKIIIFIDDANLANGTEELSDTDMRKLVVDYMSSDQLRSLEDEGMSQLHLLDILTTYLLQHTDATLTKVEEPDHLPKENPGSDSLNTSTVETPTPTPTPPPPPTPTPQRSPVGVGTIVAITAGAAGAVGAVALAPVVLGAVGFTSAGIAAGSYAASMMSAAAVANGGGVAAGSLVAVLQSAGAAGLSGAATAAVAGAGGGVGAALGAGVNKLRGFFGWK